MITGRAKALLERVRRRQGPPRSRSHMLQIAKRNYNIIAISLYHNQLEHVDRIAKAIKRTKNEPRNRSRAIQWLIEQDIVKRKMP